jgi:predicted aspartyl protease
MSYERNLVYVDVEINGTKWRFIIDTGATTVIDQKVFDAIGLKPSGSIDVRDSNGKSKKLNLVMLSSIKMGALEVQNSVAIVADLSTLKCYGIDGLIGSNLLALFDFEVDYEKQELIFHQEAVNESYLKPFEREISFKENDQRIPKLKITWHNWERSRVGLDMGSAGMVSMKRNFAMDPMYFTEKNWFYGLTSVGIYGAVIDTTYYVHIDTFKIGGEVFNHIVAKTNTGSSNLIGNKFWDDYRMLISWKRKKVFLKRNESEQEFELPDGVINVYIKDNHLIVAGIFENSRLKNEGLLPGDKIISVNGDPMNNISDDEYCTWKDAIQEDKNYTLKILTKGGIKSITVSGAELKRN